MLWSGWRGSATDAPVGACHRRFIDPSRRDWIAGGPRPLTTTVWYPACAEGKPKRHVVGPFDTGRYEFGACWHRGQDRFPLIVLSHGTGGSAAAIAWLGVRLAAFGFVAAAVNHHGNTAVEGRLTAGGFVRWWERPQDISSLLTALLADKEIGEQVDQAKIGVAGFSLGGYSALAAVGVRLAVHRWADQCGEHPTDPICRPPPEARRHGFDLAELLQEGFDEDTIEEANGSFLDDRIKAAFVIAPVGGPIMTSESIEAISVPVSIVIGQDDNQSIPEQTAIPVGTLARGASVRLVPGAHHYAFLSEGTLWSRLLLPELFRDPVGLRRGELHDSIARQAAEFFESSLSR